MLYGDNARGNAPEAAEPMRSMEEPRHQRWQGDSRQALDPTSFASGRPMTTEHQDAYRRAYGNTQGLNPVVEQARRALTGSPVGDAAVDSVQRLAQQQQAQSGLAQGQKGLGPMSQWGTGNIQGVGGLKTGDFMGQLEGFNTQGWGTGERGTESFKNAMGRIMSRYDVTQPGAAQRLMADPEFQQLAPNAQLIQYPNGDLIDFGDGNGPVDVIRGAVEGGAGAAWQWGANSGDPVMGAPANALYNSVFPPMESGIEQQLLGGGLLQGNGMDESTSQQLLAYLMSLYDQQLPQVGF